MESKNETVYKNVVVLTNNESKNFYFLNLLGYDNIHQAPTKLFNY